MAEAIDKAGTPSFPGLIREYAGLVYGTALRITRNDTDARIATRRCFEDLGRALPSLETSVPAWLHTGAVRRSCLAAGKGVLPEPTPDPTAGLDTHAARRPDWEAVAPHVDEALEQIPERVRLPVMLRHLLGRNQGHIATALDTDQSAVARRLDEGMSHLCRQLDKSGVSISLPSLASLLSRNAAVTPPADLLAELQNMQQRTGPPPLRGTRPPSYMPGPARPKRKLGCGTAATVTVVVGLAMGSVLLRCATHSPKTAPADPAQTGACPQPAGPIEETAVEPPTLVTMDLRDGRQLKGAPAFTSVKLRASFGELDLAIGKIREISFGRDRKADVVLRNGDTVNGIVECEFFELQTADGQQSVTRVEEIRRIGVRSIDPFNDRLKHGLLLHYSFNSGGDRITDDSGNDNHGAFNGKPRLVQGARGSALRFDGGGDYVVAPVTRALRNLQTSDFTIAAWFKAHRVPEKNTDALAIVMKPGYNLGLVYGHDSMIRFDMYMRVDPKFDTENPADRDGIMRFRVEAGSYPINEWHHVVGVARADTKRLLLYIDGKRVADAQWDLDWKVLDYSRAEWCVAIAQPNGDTWRWPADATIDEVCLYDRSLSDDEVLDLFNSSGGNNLPAP